MNALLDNRIVLPGLVIIMLIFTSLACGGTPTPAPKIRTATSEPVADQPVEIIEALPTPTIEPTPKPTETIAPTDTPVPELYLGDAYEQDGYALTAISIADPAAPGRFYEPEKGKRLVAVEIVVSNVSSDPITINPLDTTLVDNEGFLYMAELGSVDGQLQLVDLGIGEKIRGWVGYVIPEAAIPASIKYSATLLNDLQTSLMPAPDGHQTIVQSQSPSSGSTLPKLGDVVEQYGYSLSAVTLEDPAPQGSLYQPKEGYKLIAVEIVLGNVSGEALSTNPLDAYLVDSNGFVYTAELGGRDGQLELADLNTGEKIKGWVAFTIPVDAIPASIKFATESLSGNYIQAGVTN